MQVVESKFIRRLSPVRKLLKISLKRDRDKSYERRMKLNFTVMILYLKRKVVSLKSYISCLWQDVIHLERRKIIDN